ncbi:P-loop NTPase fold protein [Sedimenticola selenatireducens]|uniref:KAP family P-loop NTPase fold protein n=1 Tax=Sedimenticola selenatireducens TaxID=191960 RepID=UPI002AAB4EEE|nr:P-loop NTPase fold protein [Sedimenticola selenatireducens]
MSRDSNRENTNSFHDDKPIDGTAENPDSLGRLEFAQRVANTIFGADAPSSVSVSLEGDWGSGKTSLINLIERKIKERKDETVTVKFNPWLVGSADALVSQLMTALRQGIKKKDASEAMKAIAKSMDTYSAALDVVSLASNISAETLMLSKGAKGLSKLFKIIGEAKSKDIHATKEALVKELDKHNVRIVIFIDDLDRLPPTEIFEVIRAIKAVIDFPNTSYLVAYDAQYISQALTSLSIKSPERYLEKIFQIRLHVPQLTTSYVESLANFQLSELSDEDLTQYFEEDQERLGKVFHTGVKHLIKTPRELKRMFNGLRFRMDVAKGEVCFADMLGLEVLHTRFPNLYSQIRRHPSLVLHKDEVDYWGLLDEDKEEKDRTKRRDVLLGHIPHNEIGHTFQILEELFPDVRQSEWERETVDSASAKGRVCAYDRFFLAMNSSLPTEEVSIKEIREWAEDDNKSEQILQSVLDQGISMKFLELANEHASIMKFTNFIRVLGDINRLVHSKEAIVKSKGLFTMGGMATDYARWMINNQLKQIQSDEVRETLDAILSVPDLVGVARILLRSLCENQGRHWQQETINRELEFSDQEFAVWEKIFVENFIGHFQTGSIVKLINASGVFYDSLRYLRQPVIEILLQRLGTDDIDLLLTSVFIGGTDSTGGPYVHMREQDFNEDSLFGGELPFEALEAYVQRRKGDYDRNAPEVCALFKSIGTQSKCYLRDCQTAEYW